jgi:Raf kinase inhibitor-like YbhB/YbcL family protein
MATLANLKLSSRPFLHDGRIPKKFTCQGSDISPALAWSGAPANTQSFALIMEDPDASRVPFVHWLVYDLPAGSTGIPEGLPKRSNLQDGTLQGKNGFGKIGYGGPCPPPGSSHRYVFKLYALDTKLKIKPEASRSDLWNAIEGHILDKAELVGRYPTSQQTEAAEGPGLAVERKKSRLQALGEDPNFRIKTHKLQMELKKAHSLDPPTVQKFFRSVAFSRRQAEIQEFLKEIDNKDVRRTLEDYLTYANRYRVYFTLRTDPLEFIPRAWSHRGQIFHARVVRDRLQPPALDFVPDDEDTLMECLRADDLEVSPGIKKLVDAGKATFLRIDEKEGFSILRQVEDIAHKDDGVAIIEHNAEQPYFIVICGPKMNKQLLANLGPALTEFQRDRYDESFGGRPRDVGRLKQDLEAEKKGISQKEKAIDSVGTDQKKLNAEQVRLARLRSEIRRTKP